MKIENIKGITSKLILKKIKMIYLWLESGSLQHQSKKAKDNLVSLL